jgi:glycosyltransferase involved in cell wall biosynthesis
MANILNVIRHGMQRIRRGKRIMGKPVGAKLHIFIFAYWHDKGWEKFVGATVKVWDLAHNMAGLGHSVVLFLPKYNFQTENLPFRLVQIPVFDFPFLRSLSFNFFLTAFLVRYYFKARPDVFYIRRGISLIPVLFAKLRNAMLFYEINDDPYPEQTNPPTGFSFRVNRWLSVKTDEISLFLCDAAFVITKEIRSKIIRSLPNIDLTKLHLLPSGANTDLFRPLDQQHCRSKLNLDVSKKYVGFVGTLLDHQGVDVLINAAPTVIERFPGALFVVIGEGPLKERWRQQAQERGLGNYFLFTGQVAYEQIPLWINAMDVCTAPFLVKAGLRSPVKVFDYLACGRPVVASRIAGTTDIFEGSGAVVLIEPENRDALAGAIVGLLEDEDKAGDMGMKGRYLVKTRYDRKVLAGRIQQEVYAFAKAKGKMSHHASD